jgi:hypothetical protein
MYRGFNLSVPPSCFEAYENDGQSGYQAQKARIGRVVDSFKDSDGRINAVRLTANWFPQMDCQVFISHAHKDSELAIGLAGFLRCEFGISSFIDSCLWGYSDDLLQMIDDEYCWKKRNGAYSYQKRNKSTTHVHIMLSTALIKMINGCECVIFLNTPESILSSDYISGYATESPWIYAEVAMTSLIQKRGLTDHRRLAKRLTAAADEALRVKYGVDLEHLTSIGKDELIFWREQGRGLENFAALDILYEIT